MLPAQCGWDLFKLLSRATAWQTKTTGLGMTNPIGKKVSQKFFSTETNKARKQYRFEESLQWNKATELWKSDSAENLL